MPTPSGDDDVASNRIHHADGTVVSGPVTAAAATVYAVLNRLNPNALSDQAQRDWLNGMLTLSAAP